MTTAFAARPSVVVKPAVPFRRARYAVIVVTTALVNLIVLLIGSSAGATMIVDTPAATEIGLPVVLAASIVPLTLAGVATWLVATRLPAFRVSAFRSWAARIVGVVALLSAIAPFAMATDVATGATLAAMHLIVGGAFLLALLTGRARA
jgi:hypothetical protein